MSLTGFLRLSTLLAGTMRAMSNMGLSQLRVVNPAEFDAYRIEGISHKSGDLIRAKVISLKGGPQLATDKPDLGCVKAWNADGVPLVRDGNRLKDPDTALGKAPGVIGCEAEVGAVERAVFD